MINKIEFLKIKELSEAIDSLIDIESSCEDDDGKSTLNDLNNAWNKVESLNKDVKRVFRNVEFRY